MPLSVTVRVPASLSTVSRMKKSLRSIPTFSSVRERKQSLSMASEALEISSRRKISWWVYMELIIISSSRLDSALNCFFAMMVMPPNHNDQLGFNNILYCPFL